MYVPYNQINSDAKVWIYQSDRAFNASEKIDIESQLIDLCNNWNSHGVELHCSFQLHDWFICLFVDENNQSSGIGRELLSYLKRDFKSNISVDTRTNNKRGINFYTKNGFKAVRSDSKNTVLKIH